MHVLSSYCLYLEGPIPWLHGNDVLTSIALNSLGTFCEARFTIFLPPVSRTLVTEFNYFLASDDLLFADKLGKQFGPV